MGVKIAYSAFSFHEMRENLGSNMSFFFPTCALFAPPFLSLLSFCLWTFLFKRRILKNNEGILVFCFLPKVRQRIRALLSFAFIQNIPLLSHSYNITKINIPYRKSLALIHRYYVRLLSGADDGQIGLV